MSRCMAWKVAVFGAGALLASLPAAVAAAPEQGAAGQQQQQAAEGGGAAEQADAAQSEAKRESRESRRERMRKRMEAALFKGIELSDEQRAELDAFREATYAAMAAWREEHKEELEAIRRAMHEARQEDDQAKAEAAREQFHALMQDAPSPDQFHDGVKAVLTEAQRPAYEANLQAWRDEMRQRWERRDREKGDAKEDKSPRRDEPQREGDTAERDTQTD